MGEVVALDSRGETPSMVRDWLSERIDGDNVERVLVVVQMRDSGDRDNHVMEYMANGTRGDWWWLVSWCHRVIQRRFFS